MSKTFRGGVHPAENKLTRDAPIISCDLPARVTLLLSQHIGAPCAPAVETLTRPVVPAVRSRTNTSLTPLVSPETRFDAYDANATYRPSPLQKGCSLLPLP